MYINPSMGLNASCFLVRKKHLPVISPGISLPSFIQSHALAQASQAVGQRFRSCPSNNPTLVQCLVFYVLSYHWTGTLLGQLYCKTVVGLKWQSMHTPNQVPAYIAYRVSIQNNIHEAFSQC